MLATSSHIISAATIKAMITSNMISYSFLLLRFGHNNEFNALYSYNFYECAFFDEGLITAYSGPFLAFYPHLSCFKRPDLCCDPSRFSDEGLRIGAYPACLELFHKDLSGEKEQTERYYQENDELSDNRHMEHREDQEPQMLLRRTR